jgi:hypothetical protein
MRCLSLTHSAARLGSGFAYNGREVAHPRTRTGSGCKGGKIQPDWFEKSTHSEVQGVSVEDLGKATDQNPAKLGQQSYAYPTSQGATNASHTSPHTPISE